MYEQSRLQADSRQSAQSNWADRYGDIARLRLAAHPAYCKAVVPILSALTESYESPVRVLTVGGGDGHFSRSVLPEIIATRAAGGKVPPLLLVTETDPDPIVNVIPGDRKQIGMQDIARHFKASSFDLVFGESMFHHLLPDLASPALKGFQTVVAPGGVFVHLHNAIPHHDLAGLDTASTFGFSPGRPTASFVEPATENIRVKLEEAEEVSNRLMRLMNDAATREGISFLGLYAKGEALVDGSMFRSQLAQYLEGAKSNYMINFCGAIALYTRDDVPKGKVKIEYHTAVSIFANHSTRKILTQLEGRLL